MNALPKYVLTHGEETTGWANSHAIRAEDVRTERVRQAVADLERRFRAYVVDRFIAWSLFAASGVAAWWCDRTNRRRCRMRQRPFQPTVRKDLA